MKQVMLQLILTLLAKYFILTVVFQLKHFVADFLLQGKYMLGKFKEKGWVLPLLAHVGVHGTFIFVIAYANVPSLRFATILSLLDMGIHFVMDRIKASPKMLGRYEALSKKEMIIEILPGLQFPEGSEPKYNATFRLRSNVLFWWSLGLDQLVHGLTHEFLVLLIMLGSLY